MATAIQRSRITVFMDEDAPCAQIINGNGKKSHMLFSKEAAVNCLLTLVRVKQIDARYARVHLDEIARLELPHKATLRDNVEAGQILDRVQRRVTPKSLREVLGGDFVYLQIPA